MHKSKYCLNDNAKYLKMDTAIKRYSLSRNFLNKTARDAKAIIKIGRSVLIDADVLDEYLSNLAKEQN